MRESEQLNLVSTNVFDEMKMECKQMMDSIIEKSYPKYQHIIEHYVSNMKKNDIISNEYLDQEVFQLFYHYMKLNPETLYRTSYDNEQILVKL